jgi:hypothetical protein
MTRKELQDKLTRIALAVLVRRGGGTVEVPKGELEGEHTICAVVDGNGNLTLRVVQ